ncbi:MAG: trehalase family glycosidase, partial [Candidatus Halalkalibacterium sp. M3_1C_030]
MTSISPEIVDNFIQLSGPLFEDVQQSGIFKDSKTFVDCVPKANPEEIRKAYVDQKTEPHFNLKAFVYEHFRMPDSEETEIFKPGKTMDLHIEKLWDYLSRRPDKEVSDFSTLIPLPHPYIVPGGRFREIYYWDTYFTAEGLAAAGRLDTVKNLTRNFAYLVKKVGHVPNGNRYYYISRSQPPFLIMLVDLIARREGDEAVEEFIPALKQEYEFWMDGSETVSNGETLRRVVNIDGCVMNRYWDDRPLPREESWREDFDLATGLNSEETVTRYRHLRAGAESGWDFTSRWFRDEESLNTIRTCEILPVDLNALLWYMEHRLGQWTNEERYVEASLKRKTTFERFFWDQEN